VFFPIKAVAVVIAVVVAVAAVAAALKWNTATSTLNI
jgi:hypothetical protein